MTGGGIRERTQESSNGSGEGETDDIGPELGRGAAMQDGRMKRSVSYYVDKASGQDNSSSGNIQTHIHIPSLYMYIYIYRSQIQLSYNPNSRSNPRHICVRQARRW